jgi:hypothetical protein
VKIYIRKTLSERLSRAFLLDKAIEAIFFSVALFNKKESVSLKGAAGSSLFGHLSAKEAGYP